MTRILTAIYAVAFGDRVVLCDKPRGGLRKRRVRHALEYIGNGAVGYFETIVNELDKLGFDYFAVDGSHILIIS